MTFRIGHHPHLITSITSLNELKIPIRILIGVGDNDLRRAEQDSSLAVAEEIKYRGGTSFSLRYRVNRHSKGWIFEYRKETIALVGSRNLNLSTWEEIMVMIGGDTASELKKMFKVAWKGGRPIEVSPLTIDIVNQPAQEGFEL